MADLDLTQLSSSNKTSSLHGNWISKVALSLFFGYDFLNIVAVFVFFTLLAASIIAFLLVAYVQCKNLWTPTSGQRNRVFRCSYVVILTVVVVVVVLFLVHYFKSSQDDVIFVQCFLVVSFLLLIIHTIVIARIVVYIQLRNLRPELRGIRFSIASVPPLRLFAEPSQGPVLLKKYSSSHSASTPHNRSPPPLPPATGPTGDTISAGSLASPSYHLDSSDPKDIQQPHSADMTAYYLSSRPAPATPGWYSRSLSADADNKSVVSTKPPPSPTKSCSYLTLVPYHDSSSSPDPPSPTTRRDYVESVKYEVLSEQTKKKSAVSNSVSVPNQAKSPSGVEFNLRLDKQSRVAELKMTVSMDALNLICEQSTDTL